MLSQDLLLVIGIVVLGFSVPSIFGALAEKRPPRVASIAVLIGGTLILLAYSQKPGGYPLREIPEAFIRVVAHYIR